jgi:citrate synthase
MPIAGVKAKREKLFGFGHRVYKNFDPRAKIIRGVAEDVFKIAGRDPLIEVAIALQVRLWSRLRLWYS